MRKRKIVALILAIVMIIALPVGVYFYPSLFNNNNNNGGNNGGGNSGNGGNNNAPTSSLTSQQVAYVVGEVCEQNYKILDGYAENSDVGNAAYNGEGSNEVENYSTEDAIPEYLMLYFNALSVCLQVPAALDYVMNSSNSQAYSNSFTLGQTYFCRDVYGERDLGEGRTEELVDIYYYKAEAIGDKIALYLEMEGQTLICQVEYDFDTDTLISARTFTGQMFAEIDYSRNAFEVIGLYNNSLDEIQNILDGEFDYNDIDINAEYDVWYRGNITNNVNLIEFEEISLTSSGADVLFNSYIKRFALGVDADKIFDTANVVINNSFVDAMDYSMRRLDFKIQKKNEFKYEFVSTWVTYEDSLKFMNALVNAEEFSGLVYAKTLVEECRDILEARGEGAYTGELDFAVTGSGNKVAYLRVNKVNNDVNAYNVSYSYGDEFVEFSCKYENNTLTSMEDAYFGVSWGIGVDTDGSGNEYVYITRVDTVKMSIDIPETMEVEVSEGATKTLPVKELRNFYCYSYINSSVNRTIINIPACVETITVGSYLEVAAINVAEGNPNYNSVDGVLFSKDMTLLLKYPSQRANESYSMPDSVVLIAQDAFCDLVYLKNLTISSNLRPFDYSQDYETYGYMGELNARNFWLAWSLQNVYVPAGGNANYSSIDGIVYSADGETLVMCPMGRIGEVSIPNSVTTIGEYAFGYCKYVTKVTIPNSVTKIEDLAFSNCESLKEIYIPASVETIDFGAFNTLEKFEIASNHPTYLVENGIVYNKDKTTLYYCTMSVKGDVTIPSTVTKIDEYAFAYHTGITSVVIPASVTTIGLRAFLYSSVKEVTILGTVVIDYEAFFRSDLEVLNIKGLTKEEGWSGIDGMEWDAVEDCENIKTINFGGTKEEWDTYGPSTNFENFYSSQSYVKIVVNFVVSGESSIVYERTRNY